MTDLTKNLPESPGVYLFKNAKGEVLYVGKAGNIKRRVSSYFKRVKDPKLENLLGQTKKIDYKKTDTAIEALILEAELIKKLDPPYNVRDKDDKSFLYVEITKDETPRVMLVRGKESIRGERFGPFTSAASIRKAMRIIRRIFPYNVHPPSKIGRLKRPCFDNQIGLCPGTCVGIADKKEVYRNLKHIKLFLKGKKLEVLKSLEREMNSAAKELNYEEAENLRRQMFALQHIQDIAFITSEDRPCPPRRSVRKERVEGYDVSNISGTSAVGAMAVFVGGDPARDEYRKFRIRTVRRSDDVGMLREILQRRFKNDWPIPDLILIDGGKGQVNAAKSILEENGLKLPIIGIAKGPARKKNEFIGRIPKGITKKLLMQVRDEAHRFAVSYHRELRKRKFVS